MAALARPASVEDIVVESRGPGVAARGVTSVDAGTDSPPAGASDPPEGRTVVGVIEPDGGTVAAGCEEMIGAIDVSDTSEPETGVDEPLEPITGAITSPAGPVTGASTRLRSRDTGASTGPVTGASVFVTGASVSGDRGQRGS